MQSDSGPLVYTTAAATSNTSEPQPSFASLMASATKHYHVSCLEPARRTISAACAEYAYFRPERQRGFAKEPAELENEPRESGPSTNMDEAGPDAEQMKRDLQTLFEGFLELSSMEADEVYARIARTVKDAANDEFSGLDWVFFQGVVAGGLRDLKKGGLVVSVDNLRTFPLLGIFANAREDDVGIEDWASNV